MTLANKSNLITVVADGVTSAFTFQFLIPSTASCVVSFSDPTADPVTETVVPTGSFTLTGAGDPDGGTVTYPTSGSPVTAGFNVTIERIVPLNQTASIGNQGNFYPQTAEAALDNLTMMAQQLQSAIDAVIADIAADAPAMVTSGIYSTIVATTASIDDLTATTATITDLTATTATVTGLTATTASIGDLAATTASIDDLTAATATIGTLNLDGLFVDATFTTTAVISGQTLTLSAVNFTALTLTQSAAALTVHLPAAPVDGESAGFSIDQSVTALTVAGANTVKNAPSGIQSAGASYSWIYDAGTTAWYRQQNSGQPSLPALTTTASMNFGTVATARCSTSDSTVTGAALGDFVLASSTSNLQGAFLQAAVESANTVRVYYCNLTGATVTSGAVAISITLLQKSLFGL